MNMNSNKHDGDDRSKVPKIIGDGLAYVQHGVDVVLNWSFKKLKETSKPKPTGDEHVAVKTAKKVGGFFGDIGTEYYAKYEHLKRRQKGEKYRDADWQEVDKGEVD